MAIDIPKMDWRRILFIIAIGLLAGGQTAAAKRPVIGAVIGVVIGMQGTVIARNSNGQERFLAAEARLYQGDQIETRADGFAEFLFVDETALKLGPNSVLELDQVVFLPETQNGKFLISLNQGIMRFYSGSQPSENYRVQTPTLTISPEGTIFDVIVEGDKASTIVLRSGAVVLSNGSGVRRGIKVIGRASTARRSNEAPSKPQRASADLFKQFKFLDKVPGQTAANFLKATPTLSQHPPAAPSKTPALQPEKNTGKTGDEVRQQDPDAVKSQPGVKVESILPPRKSIAGPRKTKTEAKEKAKNPPKKKAPKTNKANRPPRPRMKPEKFK